MGFASEHLRLQEEEDAKQVAELIVETLQSKGDEEKLAAIRKAVLELTDSHPIHAH